MSTTKIEWTDRTWNPVTGCTKVSDGCDHCYAEGIAHRFAGSKAFPNGFDVTLRPERLDAPLRWRKPARVFVNSMSDLFHDDVPDGFIARVFAVMALTPQHTYQILTKRHGRMRALLTSALWTGMVPRVLTQIADEVGGPIPPERMDAAMRWAFAPERAADRLASLPNVWLGVSVEDQKRADLRISALIDTPAAVRFLSCEPLLGPVDLSRTDKDALVDGGIDWVIAGGESGPGARPMHPQWARDLRDQCVAADVPFFFKQWGEWGPTLPAAVG